MSSQARKNGSVSPSTHKHGYRYKYHFVIFTLSYSRFKLFFFIMLDLLLLVDDALLAALVLLLFRSMTGALLVLCDVCFNIPRMVSSLLLLVDVLRLLFSHLDSSDVDDSFVVIGLIDVARPWMSACNLVRLKYS